MSACDGPAPEDDDPYRAMAAASLGRLPCPRMMESFQQLHAALGEMVRTREAHGVVIACMKFCDPWGIQGALLARALRQDGIPVLRLEREYFLSGEGQIATRVQAFMESMGR